MPMRNYPTAGNCRGRGYQPSAYLRYSQRLEIVSSTVVSDGSTVGLSCLGKVMGFLRKLVATVVNLVLAHLRISGSELRKAINVVQPDPSTTVLGVLRLRAIERSADFAAKEMQNCLIFDNPTLLREFTATLVSQSASGAASAQVGDTAVLEFGVWQGTSIHLWARACPEFKVTGFDAFLGLSEDWVGTDMAKGSFSRGGTPPEVPSNVNLEVGWVEDTLPGYLQSTDLSSLRLVHMDFDTYSPTYFALTLLRPILQPGVLVLFDDFFGYPGWEGHEYKALIDSGINFKYVAFAGGSGSGHPQNCLIEVI